ncbi:MAG: LptF/LptG family permease [bacterium]
MKLITRYLLKELSFPFLIGLLLFTGILLTHQLFDLADLIINKGFAPAQVAGFIASGIPTTFFFTIPMAVLLATLMAFGRLAGDLELTVLRASGYPLRSFITPPLIAATVLTAGLLGLREYGLPPLSRYQEQLMLELEIPEPPRLMVPGRHLNIGPYTIFAENIYNSKMEDVFLEDSSAPESPLTVYARQGRWEKIDPITYFLHLKNGTMHQLHRNGEYRNIRFDKQMIRIELKTFSVNLQEVSGEVPPLTTLYKEYIQAGNHYHKQRQKNQENNKRKLQRLATIARKKSIDFHQELSLPFATLFLVLLGTPLGILTSKMGKSLSFTLSLGIIVLYYLFLTGSEPLAVQGWIPAAWAMWLPNIIYGLCGGGLLLYLNKKGH